MNLMSNTAASYQMGAGRFVYCIGQYFVYIYFIQNTSLSVFVETDGAEWILVSVSLLALYMCQYNLNLHSENVTIL